MAAFFAIILTLLIVVLPAVLILKAVDSSRKGQARQRQEHANNFANVLQQYIDNPASAELQNHVMRTVATYSYLSKIGYDATLVAVEKTNGSPPAKRVALEVGRLHFGTLRPDRRPTIYDENAIQNDIQTRIA